MDVTKGIWVDTDPTLGSPWSDVDDVLAVELVHRRGRLAGLSSVFGNRGLDTTHRVASDLGRRFGVPVARGAAAPSAVRSEAVDALVAHRGPVLALGPCTNIAAALAEGACWSRLVVLGGAARRLPNLRPLHTTELNFALDEGAASAVLSAGRDGRVDLELVPMEPCRRVWAGAPQLARLPEWLAAGCRPWLRTSRLRHPWGPGGFHPWDVLAAAAAVGVEPCPFSWGRCGVWLDGRPGRQGHVRYGAGSVRVLLDVDPAGLLEAWLR